MSRRVIQFSVLCYVALAFGGIACLPGCAPTALPREFGEVARTVAASLTDQAVWQSVVANVDGQVIEPGIEVHAGVLYVARARLVGVSGQVGLRGSGVGSGEGVSDEVRAAIIAELARDGTIDRLIRAAASQPTR